LGKEISTVQELMNITQFNQKKKGYNLTILPCLKILGQLHKQMR